MAKDSAQKGLKLPEENKTVYYNLRLPRNHGDILMKLYMKNGVDLQIDDHFNITRLELHRMKVKLEGVEGMVDIYQRKHL